MDSSTGEAFERQLDVVRARGVEVAAGSVDDDGLRDLLVGAETLRNAVEALQGQVMVELRDRAHRADLADDAIKGTAYVPSGAREEFVADEVAVLLTCTRVAAGHRLATALAAAECGPVAEAWRPMCGGWPARCPESGGDHRPAHLRTPSQGRQPRR